MGVLTRAGSTAVTTLVRKSMYTSNCIPAIYLDRNLDRHIVYRLEFDRDQVGISEYCP